MVLGVAGPKVAGVGFLPPAAFHTAIFEASPSAFYRQLFYSAISAETEATVPGKMFIEFAESNRSVRLWGRPGFGSLAEEAVGHLPAAGQVRLISIPDRLMFELAKRLVVIRFSPPASRTLIQRNAILRLIIFLISPAFDVHTDIRLAGVFLS